MKAIEGVIFALLLILVNNQVPSGNAINSCGKKGYTQPTSSDDCVENGEICCFVKLTIDSTNSKAFCASSPSRISKNDIIKEIEDYTGYKLEAFECNNSKYIKNIIGSLLLVLFILV